MHTLVSSILTGVASVFCLQGNTDKLSFMLKSDEEALAGDWKTVGDDIRRQLPEETQGSL